MPERSQVTYVPDGWAAWRSPGRARRLTACWSVAYCSRMTRPLSDDELANLSSHADARNLRLGVFGVLFVAGDHFLQVLEGNRAPLRWLYRKISEDARHRQVIRLTDKPVQHHAFTGWSMRLVREQDLPDDERLRVVRALEADTTGGPSDDLLACPALLVRGVLTRAEGAMSPAAAGGPGPGPKP